MRSGGLQQCKVLLTSSNPADVSKGLLGEHTISSCSVNGSLYSYGLPLLLEGKKINQKFQSCHFFTNDKHKYLNLIDTWAFI